MITHIKKRNRKSNRKSNRIDGYEFTLDKNNNKVVAIKTGELPIEDKYFMNNLVKNNYKCPCDIYYKGVLINKSVNIMDLKDVINTVFKRNIK